MPDYFSLLPFEEKLMLRLCRLEFTVEQEVEIDLLVNTISDWNKFIKLINNHGVIAICWFNLNRIKLLNSIPVKIVEEMHQGYLKSLARNTLIYSLLEEVLKIAESKNIKIVLLKGLYLEKLVYQDKGIRQMNDLDILVRKKDAVPLRKALLLNGFESAPFVSPLHETIWPSYNKHLPEMIKNGISIEIHFELFDRFDSDINSSLMEKSIQVCINGREVLFLPPLLSFLYLVRHLEHHETEGASQVRLYTDLAVLLLKYENLILKDEDLSNASPDLIRDTLQKIFILKTFWGIQLPPFIETKLESIDKEESIKGFLDLLKNANIPEMQLKGSGLLIPLHNIDGIWNKLLFIIGDIFPSLTFMKFRYSIKSNFICLFFYPVRWGKLFYLLFSGKL